MVARLAGGLPLTEKDEKVYTEAVHWSGKGGVIMPERNIRVAICDDDPADLQQTEAMLREVAAQAHITCDVCCFHEGQKLLQAMEQGEAFSILFLDVVMPDMGGIQLASVLRARQDGTAIVFVSSNRDMALQGYEVAAVRYLAKPLEREKLREALVHCCQHRQGMKELILSTARGKRRFAPENIAYIETWGRGVRLHLGTGEQEDVCMRISEIEKLLPASQFMFCHRTVVVNLAWVQYLRHCEIELKTGAVLPVSKYRQNDTREKLMNYLEG